MHALLIFHFETLNKIKNYLVFLDFKQIKMKILLIVLVLRYATESQSSCIMKNEFVISFPSALYETRSPLTDLLKYKEIKEEVESFLHLKLKTQNCSIKDICSKVINKKKAQT